LILPFGKFKGRDLRDVDGNYLDWLSSIELRPALAKAVAAERFRRIMADSASERFALSAEQRSVAKEIIESGRRSLAARHHPDRGGSLATMQNVNVVSDVLLKQIGGAHRASADTRDY
jgi:hypothetical protein